MTREKVKKENIEALMKQIENIIEELESGEIDLDESIKKYESGMFLIEKCKKILKESKLKIETLKRKANMEIDDKDRDEDENENENDDVNEEEEKLF